VSRQRGSAVSLICWFADPPIRQSADLVIW
jgi:hypothetical protein